MEIANRHSLVTLKAGQSASDDKSAITNGTDAVIIPPLMSPVRAPSGFVDFAMTGKVVSAAVAPQRAIAANFHCFAIMGTNPKEIISRKKLIVKASKPASAPQIFATATPLSEYQPQALPIAAPVVIDIPISLPTNAAAKVLDKIVPTGSKINFHR